MRATKTAEIRTFKMFNLMRKTAEIRTFIMFKFDEEDILFRGELCSSYLRCLRDALYLTDSGNLPLDNIGVFLLLIYNDQTERLQLH